MRYRHHEELDDLEGDGDDAATVEEEVVVEDAAAKRREEEERQKAKKLAKARKKKNKIKAKAKADGADHRVNYDESMARAARRRRAEGAWAARARTAWIGATMRNGAYGRLMDLVARVDRDGVFGLALPTIVVVGLESHGKSSLMERIALRDVFPRGVGFVTRMPILLQLRQVNFENSVIIRLVRLSGASWVPVENSEKKFYDSGQRNFAEVVAERMQRFISQRGQGSGNMQIAIDHRIEIEIRAADLVDIDLLDLPGIVSMPQDVAAASLQLTRNFLQRDDTLALCIVDDLLPAVMTN